MLAVRRGDDKLVRLLIKRGADVAAVERNEPSRHALCPIHMAAVRHDESVAKALAEAGASVEERTGNDLHRATPMLMALDHCGDDAVEEAADALVKRLILHEASVNAADSRGRTPLMAAARRGWAKVVRTLLEAGADAKAQDFDGRTAINHATDGEHWAAIEALESHVVDAE